MDFKDGEMTFKDASHILEMIREECMKRPELVKEEYRSEKQEQIIPWMETCSEGDNWIASVPFSVYENRGSLLSGHCYVASEAFHHLVGGSPTFVRHEGVPHWYITLGEVEDRRMVADPTVEQFETEPPYGEGVGKGFLTTEPSKRAQEVIEAVQKRL